MSRSYVSKELRRKIAQQALYRCGYCLTVEDIVGYKMDVEHIISEAAGGPTEETNLWLSCSECNTFKSDKTETIDPVTNNMALLFNPREQSWIEHFEWSNDGLTIVGKTPTGRATVEALRLNREWLVSSRGRWVQVGWHPPKD